MIIKQGINIFLPLEQYKAIKRLAYNQDVPYVTLIREGVSLVLDRYREKSIKKA